MSNTQISISEKIYNGCDVHPALRREKRIIIHDGWQWHMGNIPNEEQLQEFLKVFEIELTDTKQEVEHSTTGKIKRYNLSKEIISNSLMNYWSLEQLKEMTNNEPLKKVKGMSNGSLVDCYIRIGKNKVEVYRPNPNAKEVYNPMELKDHINYKKNYWSI